MSDTQDIKDQSMGPVNPEVERLMFVSPGITGPLEIERRLQLEFGVSRPKVVSD